MNAPPLPPLFCFERVTILAFAARFILLLKLTGWINYNILYPSSSVPFRYVLMQVMRRTVGIDVSADIEEQGLDVTQIGEEAYDTRLDPLLDLGLDALTRKLIEAAHIGSVEQIENLIRAGAKPGRADYDGRTPAHIAAAEGRLRVLK